MTSGRRLWEGGCPPFTFANTRGLDRLKDHLHGLGVPVTWMTSYGVARDARSAAVLHRAAAEGDEIAGHLHGWETPPFVEMDEGARPFIYEYPRETRFEKHQSLVAAHEDAFTPAGLFGAGAVGAGVARLAGGRGPADQMSRWAYRALDATGLHRLVWVRPLKHPRSLLVAAARSLVGQGARIINVMFHSSEAFVGTSPVSRTEGDVVRLYDDVTAIVLAVHQAGVVPRTLRDATTLGSST